MEKTLKWRLHVETQSNRSHGRMRNQLQYVECVCVFNILLIDTYIIPDYT